MSYIITLSGLLRHLTFEDSMPLYCCRQWRSVGSVTSMTWPTLTKMLGWAISFSALFSLQMICSVVCLIGYMGGFPGKSAQMSTLIHHKAISGSTSAHARATGVSI